MKGIIIAGGNCISSEKLKEIIPDYDIVVAADSGLKHLNAVDVKPDYLVGDFDSVDKSLLAEIDISITSVVRHPVEKDKTDTELAIDVLNELNVDDITILGGTGSRLDHTLSNIFSLRYIYDLGLNGTIIDEYNSVTYIRGVNAVSMKNEGTYISVLPISDIGAEISLKGFHYPLDHKCLIMGSSLGVSNYIVKNEGTVICHKGEALIIKARD